MVFSQAESPLDQDQYDKRLGTSLRSLSIKSSRTCHFQKVTKVIQRIFENAHIKNDVTMLFQRDQKRPHWEGPVVKMRSEHLEISRCFYKALEVTIGKKMPLPALTFICVVLFLGKTHKDPRRGRNSHVQDSSICWKPTSWAAGKLLQSMTMGFIQ